MRVTTGYFIFVSAGSAEFKRIVFSLWLASMMQSHCQRAHGTLALTDTLIRCRR